MDREIVPKELTDVVQYPATLEEFKALCLNDTIYKPIDKLADAFDKLPMCIKLLKNLDPTGGFLSYFADALSELKTKRNEEKLWKALYELFKALRAIDRKQGRINPEYFESQVIALTEMYFDYSMRAYQLEKIEIFRNAFIRGVIDYERTLDEKENIFNLIASLTLEQVRILKFCYDNQHEYHDEHHDLHQIGRREIADRLNLEESYVDIICQGLNGKGLLIGRDNSKQMHSDWGYNAYLIPKYLERLINYVTESDSIIP